MKLTSFPKLMAMITGALVSFPLMASAGYQRKLKLGNPANSTKPSNALTKRKAPRRLYLDFSDSNRAAEQNSSSEPNLQSERQYSSPFTNRVQSHNIPGQKVGFSNDLQIGYSNSAYRYAGEEYPEKSIDFLLNPVFESKCFDLTCKYFAKMTGGLNLNEDGKGEVSMFQFGLKIPTDAWMGYFKPTYSVFGVLPTTEKQLQVEHQLYGVGAGFSLATTPELFDSKLLKLTAGMTIKKNIHETSLDKLQSFVNRQFLMTDIMFSSAFSAELIFGHIDGITYDGTDKQILEMSQYVTWQATDVFSFSLGHSNTGPLLNDAGQRLDTSLVSIDNSVISFSVGVSNSF